jgi:hypothetical protein
LEWQVTKSRQDVIDKNFQAFQEMLPTLLVTHKGRYALLREEKIVEFFDSMRDALIYGRDNFADGLFSIQQVTDTAEDLGYFSHAVTQHSV